MRRYISAYFEDEENLLRATKELRAQDVTIQDVLTPFPVHGLDQALGFKRSNLPTVAFICGGIGLAVAFGFQTWAFTVDYPLFIGGKPHFAIPSFIPITFEITVLFASFGMAIAFFIRSKLGPGANNVIHDERITDDHFVIIVDLDEAGSQDVAVKSILEKEDAMNIQVKEIES